MRQYLDLVQTVLDQGSWQENRTGIRTLSVPGAMMRFDMKDGFPAITTKKLAFKSAVSEMIGFLRGYRNAADFRALGCKVWDQNANENPQWLANPNRLGLDDLGNVYGVQWRHWPAYKVINNWEPKAQERIEAAINRGYHIEGKITPLGQVIDTDQDKTILLSREIDQVRECLDLIVKDPGNRRILFHGWNPAELDGMALPPCHLLYQFLVNQEKQELSLCLYVRSNDLGLGTPFNVTEGATLLHLFARLTGLTPRFLVYQVGDLHVYENHIEMLTEQLKREPLPAPKLVIADRIPSKAATGRYEPEWLDKLEPNDFALEGYQHHPHLTAPMAV